ncbi:hypothetical protein Q7P37_005248 [Cladosporium fusiforme]
MKADEIHMQGGGYYNENCILQRLAIEMAFSVFDPIDFQGEAITLADYGSSEGHNSIQLMRRVLAQLPSLTSATVVFNDTPTNDFTSLSNVLSAQMPSLTQKNRLAIHPLLSPKSFFKQILPPNSVDAGFCFTALHWLQRLPPVEPSISTPLTIAATAHSDLITFLAARHAELVPGGTLTLCIPIQGPVSVTPAHDCLHTTIKLLPKSYGLHPSSITSLPMYFRTMEELLLGVESSPGAWRVLQKRAVPITHPTWPAACIPAEEMLCNSTAETARTRYANAITGQTLAAISGILVEQARAGWREADAYPGDEKFLEDLRECYKREFMRGYVGEEVGFTYGYLRLEKV